MEILNKVGRLSAQEMLEKGTGKGNDFLGWTAQISSQRILFRKSWEKNCCIIG